MEFCGSHAFDYYGHDFEDGDYVEWVATFKLDDGETEVSQVRYHDASGEVIVKLDAATQAKVDAVIAHALAVDESHVQARIAHYLDERWEAQRDEAAGL